MAVPFQGSLFAEADAIGLAPLEPVHRTVPGHGAWLDFRLGWVTGADELFDVLAEKVPWQAERRRMYDNVVQVPRLLAFYDADDTLPHPVLTDARRTLSERCAAELGEPFVTAGLCYYRDGRDSVAWHVDRIGRGDTQDTMVAIVSVGEPRPLLLRPRHGGGPTVRQSLGHGDLIVMGGSCRRTWDHSIPKTAKPVGPRISVQYRPRGVR